MTFKERVKHDWRFYFLVSYFVLNSILTSFALYKGFQNQDDFQAAAKNFAAQQRKFNRAVVRNNHDICEAANAGGKTVKDILNTIEVRIKNIPNPQQTSEQKQQAIKVYEELKRSIKFAQCPPRFPKGETGNGIN